MEEKCSKFQKNKHKCKLKSIKVKLKFWFIQNRYILLFWQYIKKTKFCCFVTRIRCTVTYFFLKLQQNCWIVYCFSIFKLYNLLNCTYPTGILTFVVFCFNPFKFLRPLRMFAPILFTAMVWLNCNNSPENIALIYSNPFPYFRKVY